MTRQEIAKLMNVSPARVSQYTFLPAPTRVHWKWVFFNREAVLAAIAKQYPEGRGNDKRKLAKVTNPFMKFMAGHFDPEEKQEDYENLKYWARTHPVATKRVRIKGEINMRGSEA